MDPRSLRQCCLKVNCIFSLWLGICACGGLAEVIRGCLTAWVVDALTPAPFKGQVYL